MNEIDTFFDPTGCCTDMASFNCICITFMVTKHWQKRMDVNSITSKVCKDRKSSWKNHSEATFTILLNRFYMQRHRQHNPHVRWNVDVHYVKQFQRLNDVLNWWDKRKYFLFKDFVSINGQSSNLAEFVHAGWKNSHAINLSLLRCGH